MIKYLKLIAIILSITTAALFSGCSLFQEGGNILTYYTATPTPNGEPTPNIIPEITPPPTEYFRAPAIDVPINSLNSILEEKVPKTSSQAILVTVYNNIQRLYCVEAMELGWKVVYGPFDCNIGRNGLGKLKEGDGKSPEGVFELGSAFGYGGAPAGSLWPWRESTDNDYWIEDSNSKYYNQYVSIDTVSKDWKASVKLRIPYYRRAIEVKYNTENKKGLGSAIFLQIWENENTNTGGCTAMNKDTIETVIKWLRPEAKPVLVQYKYIEPLPEGFCYIKDFAPEAKYDIRFAGEDNILGRIPSEYKKAVGISTIKMTKAIDNATMLLKDQDLRLLIYDAYRPQTTINTIVDWLNDESDDDMKQRYYPDVKKDEMLDMYFEKKSPYSRGSAVDVGIIDKDGKELDMGTIYQFIDEKSAYDYRGLTDLQRNNRELLRDIMIQSGLKPNDTLWWSFYLADETFPNTYFDFYVQ